MSYTHSGAQPVYLAKYPLDVDSTDWVYFTYEDWLRPHEVIIASSALVDGAEIITESTLIGDMMDEDGVNHTDVYGVQIKPDADSVEVTLTHRVSSNLEVQPNLSRLDIDRTVIIPVEVL